MLDKFLGETWEAEVAFNSLFEMPQPQVPTWAAIGAGAAFQFSI